MKKIFNRIAQAIVDDLLARGFTKLISDAIEVKAIRIAISEIAKIELKPGDTIVLKSKFSFSNDAIERLQESFNELFPDHEHKVIVLEEDMDLVVLSKGSS